jgi:hypothetical protein
MSNCSKAPRLRLPAALSASAVLLVIASAPAAAQEMGVGLAIGVGGALMQQMIAQPPSAGGGGSAGQASSKQKPQAMAKQSGAAGGGNGNRPSGVPPRGETRFVADEVVVEFAPNASQPAIDQIARRYNLTRLESQNFPLIGASLYHYRLGGRRSVADVIGALESERTVASAQPNYLYTLQEQSAPPAATDGDAAQYVLAKLHVREAQQIATGKDVLIAVIDSQIEPQHPDFADTIVKSFDAAGGDTTAHKHATAMAGAITAHGKLLGVAPGAKLLAAHAFGNGDAKGTSYAIYKSLQWAADNGARVVNMSFAGPLDPDLHRLLAAAYAKDLVLIAAAGNAGPKSPPLYPAADANVIAVTATDSGDGIYNMANRGDYIVVAVPGVDILAAAPAGSYQVTTGTSIAAAHVSAVAALLLERKPTLKPGEIRAMLSSSGQPLGLDASGAKLVDALRALLALGNQSAGNDGDRAKR